MAQWTKERIISEVLRVYCNPDESVAYAKYLSAQSLEDLTERFLIVDTNGDQWLDDEAVCLFYGWNYARSFRIWSRTETGEQLFSGIETASQSHVGEAVELLLQDFERIGILEFAEKDAVSQLVSEFFTTWYGHLVQVDEGGLVITSRKLLEPLVVYEVKSGWTELCGQVYTDHYNWSNRYEYKSDAQLVFDAYNDTSSELTELIGPAVCSFDEWVVDLSVSPGEFTLEDREDLLGRLLNPDECLESFIPLDGSGEPQPFSCGKFSGRISKTNLAFVRMC